MPKKPPSAKLRQVIRFVTQLKINGIEYLKPFVRDLTHELIFYISMLEGLTFWNISFAKKIKQDDLTIILKDSVQ